MNNSNNHWLAIALMFSFISLSSVFYLPPIFSGIEFDQEMLSAVGSKSIPVVSTSSINAIPTSSIYLPEYNEINPVDVKTSHNTSHSFSVDLSLNTTGPDVKFLQEKLRSIGLFSGESTSYFGPETLRAVISFQNKYNIKPASGFVGPLTRAYLNNLQTSTNTSDSQGVPADDAWRLGRDMFNACQHHIKITYINGVRTFDSDAFLECARKFFPNTTPGVNIED